MSVSLLAGSLFSTPDVHAEAHVDNPFVDATSYLNPDYSKDIDTSIAKVSDVSLKEKMQTIKNYPTGVWLDTIDAVKGGP
ncbi:MAG TPA: glycoside hydrolase family 6 protein, partial [Xylella fastidiosa subsp. pauca]